MATTSSGLCGMRNVALATGLGRYTLTSNCTWVCMSARLTNYARMINPIRKFAEPHGRPYGQQTGLVIVTPRVRHVYKIHRMRRRRREAYHKSNQSNPRLSTQVRKPHSPQHRRRSNRSHAESCIKNHCGDARTLVMYVARNNDCASDVMS